ncbi:hypothetical protein TIFTF001_031266 [Ficus carica]|uniref:Uncharacterized protein n=1 Tax=Ficus carica TaxID=3494 RepID=A0AA88J0R3_FICCA|nr:hypothetical protein TIFTF001_031266 [Ficus carica]
MNEFSSASEDEEEDRSSEDEISDEDGFLAVAVVAMAASRHNRRRDPQPMHNSRLIGSMRVEEIINGHEEIIQDLISMKSDTFKALSHVLDYVLANGVDGTGPSTGTQQDASRRGAMSQLRDVLADDMWDSYQ